MNKFPSFKWLWSIILVVYLLSCRKETESVQAVVQMAGDNKEQLLKTIKHYQQPKDSLKLKAAYFLIKNMGNKWAFDNSKIDHHSKIMDVIDSIYDANPKYKDGFKFWVDKYDFVSDYWDSLNSKFGKFNRRDLPIIMDYDVITSDFLIDNIDLAFEVWQNKPWASHLDFKQFCEFILPYRGTATHEPLQPWRKMLYDRYSWIDSFAGNTDDPVEVCGYLNDSIHWFSFNEVFNEYPDLGIQELYKTGLGSCEDRVNLASYVMRSQGVPVAAALEFSGHSWNVVLNKEGKLNTFNPGLANPYKSKNYWDEHKYAFEHRRTKYHTVTFENIPSVLPDLSEKDIPRLLRGNPNRKNITGISDVYRSDVELFIDDSNESFEYVYLCRFRLTDKKWEAVAWSELKGKRALFKNMGADKVYLPAFYKNGDYSVAGTPIYVQRDGKIIELSPNLQNNLKVNLYRKMKFGHKEAVFAQTMIGTDFQGSNDPEFRTFSILHKIKNLPMNHETVNIMQPETFRFVRYNAPNKFLGNKSLGIAELTFLDSLGNEVYGDYIASANVDKMDAKKAFDNDIRTNFNSYNPCWIGMDFGKEVEISQIKYLFRNSFNTIEPNDTYELFYWDGDWKSLGKQVATDNYIVYNVPKNSLLWLRNLTKGKAETIFFMKKGKQVWG